MTSNAGNRWLTPGFTSGQIILEPSERLNIPTDFDSFQIEIVQEGKQFTVKDVYQPAIAGVAGLKPGDILPAVDGKETSNLTLIQIKRIFKWDGSELGLIALNNATVAEALNAVGQSLRQRGLGTSKE